MKQTKTQKITLLAFFIATSLILSYVESQMPAFFMVPGMKLGLSNIVVMIALYRFGEKEALCINLLRILIVGISFGTIYAMFYALAGGIFSFIVMVILKKMHMHKIAVSIGGGIFHNIGQILVAMLLLSSKGVLYYLPVLWASGLASGCIIGILAALLLKRLKL